MDVHSGFTRSVSSLRGRDEEENKQRKTSIIATVGPKVANPGMLGKLLDEGMDVMRLNFSHGDHAYHASTIAALREALAKRPGKICAIALDTKGPEIRTGTLENGALEVKIEMQSEVEITTNPEFSDSCSPSRIYVDYKDLPTTVRPGMAIYIDDGLLNLQVVECKKDSVICFAVNSAMLGSKKGVNLPGGLVTLPAVSEKDKSDLMFGVEQGVDMIFASFIRRGEQVEEIRKVLGDAGRHIKIFSKIENQEGLDNFDEILRSTDGVMVARGDLGIEIPPSKVFTAQKVIIRKCNIAGKPVICATQMLESMIANPRPTRAEVSDVGNAITDGADCVMLSGETAKGKYPLDAVRTMDQIAREAEEFVDNERVCDYLRAKTPKPMSNMESVAHSAVRMSFDENISMIVIISETGETARCVAKYRPLVPIFAITGKPHSARQTVMNRGVFPILVPSAKFNDVNALLMMALTAGKSTGICHTGSKAIAVYDDSISDNIEEASTLRILTVD
uniref:Pyruvate kinase n=1 Tax=Timspurckia oligopyrenoides TaxID=708627 RepID=A0A7S0ZLK3_9RHOD|mmetsp:Transcript_9983/g.17976  ORF Transcript_9983/g.17976 Transcript_9983/m.17976 type:complete len:506 (+) Transcript_9983:63-1580(+)